MGRSNRDGAKRITRSREGCWSCKERRRKCTGERPSCFGCVRRHLKCEYGSRLLWQDDAELLGITFGRAGLKDRFSKDRNTGRKSHHFTIPLLCQDRVRFLNTTSKDIERFCVQYNDGKAQPEVGSHKGYLLGFLPWNLDECCSPRLAGVSIFPSLEQTETFLLDYYINVVSCRRVSLDGTQNPFRTIVLPLCRSSPSLLHAIIAVSANDLRNRNDGVDCNSYGNVVLSHKSKCLQMLRHAIPTKAAKIESASSTLIFDSVHTNSTLLTIMLLCYLEIATGCSHEWITHLRGAMSLVRYYVDFMPYRATNLFDSATLRFVYDYLSLRDIFFATTLDDEGYDKHENWTTLIPQLFPFVQDEDRTRINANVGLSAELRDIITSITALSRRGSRKSRGPTPNNGQVVDDISYLWEQAHLLKNRLKALNQWSEECDQTHLIYLNAAAFQEATWIYLRYAAFQEPADSPPIQNDHLPRLFRLISQVHDKQGELLGALPYPMWALFIAACMVQDADRGRILDLFTDLKKSRPISNVPRTMAAVEAIWKWKDLNQTVIRPVNMTNSYPTRGWEEPLIILGWKMALT